MNGSDPKLSARELLEEAHPALVGLSHWIHANPEVGFEETLASGWVAEWLATAGFEVETGVAGLPTAVIGSTGPGPFHVAICVEYDALPEVGHACGHNVIAAAGVGAGLALASVADELGLRVTVLGTPAEETGGGKLRLIEAGAFEGVHAAMMVHPWPTDVATPSIIAVNQLEVTYTGREAHAAGFPQRGLNAGDALVIAQTAIGLLRQQLLPTDRVHGIVTRGGDAPNIIPAHTSALFMVRAQDRARLVELTELVSRCFEAGALATGTQVSIVPGTAYADMIHDPDLAALYRHNAEQLGRVFEDSDRSPVSTDMGDVSHIVASIHPMIGIAADGAVNHQQAFAAACTTPSADQAILDAAVAMTWTVIDAVQDEVLRARLMGEALAREARTLTEEAEELEQDADVLADAARSLAQVDPETAGEFALASVVLDAQAQDLTDAAAERLGEAEAIQEQALLDEQAGELGAIESRALEPATEELSGKAADLAEEGEVLADEANLVSSFAEEEASNSVTLAEEAGSLEDEASNLAAGAWALADASDAALDEVADDATVALEATEEAADLEAVADTLVEEAAELETEASELAAEVDALSRQAVGVASADPDQADELAATAFEFDTRARETAAEAGMTLEQALEVEAEALAADDLAEVATEAAEDAEAEAIDEAVVAEVLAEDALETEELAEVVQEAADEAARAAESDATFAESLADEAFRTEDLAEVVEEASEDAELGALEDAAVAEALAEEAVHTREPAEAFQKVSGDAEWVTTEATDDQAVAEPVAADTAELGKGHADWEQQFLIIAAHAAWEDEYSRMLGDTDAAPDVGAADAPAPLVGGAEPPVDDGWSIPRLAEEASADEASADAEPVDAQPLVGAAPAEDSWYSEAHGPTGAAGPTLPDEPSASEQPPEEAIPETALGDFEWIPAAPFPES